MHEIQPPIQNDEELVGYHTDLVWLDAIARSHKDELFTHTDQPQYIQLNAWMLWYGRDDLAHDRMQIMIQVQMLVAATGGLVWQRGRAEQFATFASDAREVEEDDCFHKGRFVYATDYR